MSKKIYLNFLKGFILLSPIPFGCVGKVFSPFFYLTMLLLTFVGLSVNEQVLLARKSYVYFAFQNKIKLLSFIFFGFLLFQVIPLPAFLIELISPSTIRNYFPLNEKIPVFLTISQVPTETVLFGLRMLVIFLFFWSFIKIDFKRKELRSIIDILILSASLQALFGLIKYAANSKYFFLVFYEMKKLPKINFLTGTLGNANHFAFSLALIIPLLLSYFFLSIKLFETGGGLREKLIATFNQDKKIILTFILISMLSLSLLLTGSRAGVITLVTTFIIFAMLLFYLTRSKVLRKKIGMIMITIAMITIFVGVKNTSDKFLRTNFEKAGRFLRWPNSINMFKEFPVFGTGMGTYKYSFYVFDTAETGKWSKHAHNDYIETLTDGGIIGSALLLALLLLLTYSIFKMWKTRRHPQIKIYGIGILSSIYAAFFHSFFDFSLRIPSNSLLFVLLFAIGIKFATYRRQFTENGSRVRRDPVNNSHKEVNNEK